MSSPRDPLGHGRSTVSPLCVVGHWTPRTSLASQTWGSGPWGGRGGRRVTGTVAVIGRRSGCLLMEPIGREVGDRGRAVVGLALDVKGLAGRVVVTWVVVRGPEVTRDKYRESRRVTNETQSEWETFKRVIKGYKGFVREQQKPTAKAKEKRSREWRTHACEFKMSLRSWLQKLAWQ